MNKPVANEDLSLRNINVPSLYGKTIDAERITETISILGALEPSRSRSAFGWKIAGAAALVTIAVVAVASGRLDEYAVPLFEWTDASFRREVQVVSVEVPKQSAAAVAAASSDEPAVATIVSELPNTEAALQGMQANNEWIVGESPVIGPSVRHEDKQVRDGDRTNAVTVPRDIEKSTASNKGATNPLDKVSSSAKKSEPKAVAVSPQTASPKHNSKDKDVDLIAALLSHVSRPGAAGKDVVQKPANAGTPRAAVAAKEKKAEPNRDIVARVPGESTESLVKRCLALGFFEGELCRIRICSGLWGKDPACPSGAPVASN